MPKFLGAIFLLAALTACSPTDFTPTTDSVQVPPGTGSTSISPTTTSTIPPPRVAVDADQEGLAAPMWDDDAYGEPAFAQTLSELADTGAEWVTLVPTWYQTGPESSVVYAEQPGRTATDQALIVAIETARNLGLQVMLKPHVDLADGGGRDGIDPADPGQWFMSYGDVVVRYAGLAEDHGVSQFVVGTELAGTIDETDHWRSLIARVRQVFSGGVTYAANHDEYPSVRFWDTLDLVGVDAYFPLADEPTSDVALITEAWAPIVADLGLLASTTGRSVVFTEIGYPSQEGAVTAPYDPQLSAVVSEEEQAAALTAMLGAVDGQPWFGGFHWWMWFEESTELEQSLGYSPQGKPGEAILRDRWAPP